MKNYKDELKNKIKLFKKELRQSNYKIYTIQNSVSNSGMTRKLSLYIHNKKGMRRITHDVASIIGWGIDKNGDLIVHGCGMDMHFHTVYTLSCKLYGYKNEGGYKLKHEYLW